MTYVAEPYLYVADQVLTALTGGIARETHRFFAQANAFSFEIPAAQVLPDSVRVIGQANQAFFAFQIGTDFAIGGDGLLRFRTMATDPAAPAKGATWPDEATEFYVSYYHANSFQAPLTDRNVGSLARTLGEAFARELAVLRSELEFVYQSGFVDTAAGSALDMVVALFGITRKTSDFASGTVRFFRDTPAPADVFIPAGTKVSTALAGAPGKPVSFVTTNDRTLQRGQLAVEAPIRAETKGAQGVVDARSIVVVNQPVLGITGVMNDAATVFGGASETDDELRGRAKSVAERAGRATPRALLNALTELSAIKPNDVAVKEDLTGMPGVVSISIAVDPTAQLASDVHDAILDARPAGIRVVTNIDSFLPPVTTPTASTSPALRDPGSAGPVGSATAAPPGGGFMLPLTASVVVFPQDPRITGAPRAALQQAVTDTVTGDVGSSSVGGVIVYNQVTADLMGIPGVYDVVLEISPKPAPGGPAPAVTKANIYVPADRRATLEGADVNVIFAGAPVFFDFALAVTGTPPATLDAITTEVRTRLGEYLAHLPVANTVDGATLVAQLGGSELFTFNAADLSWTAEYQKAGLLLHDQGGPGAQTVLQEGDQPVLRLVTVTERQS